MIVAVFVFLHKTSVSQALSSPSSTLPPKTIIFPGGGIFFYWQAGVITHLREQSYALDNQQIRLTGASAGAICATLTALDISFEDATRLALAKAREAGVWDRPLGLYGIWGNLIGEWLEELIIDDDKLLSRVNEKVSLLVTEVPSFQTKKLSRFASKQDLIGANMASIHIPLFLDGKIATPFRGLAHIDGSFLAQTGDYCCDEEQNNSVTLNWGADPYLSNRNLGDAVTALNEEGIWDLVDRGRKYAIQMEKRGDFDCLQI